MTVIDLRNSDDEEEAWNKLASAVSPSSLDRSPCSPLSPRPIVIINTVSPAKIVGTGSADADAKEEYGAQESAKNRLWKQIILRKLARNQVNKVGTPTVSTSLVTSPTMPSPRRARTTPTARNASGHVLLCHDCVIIVSCLCGVNVSRLCVVIVSCVPFLCPDCVFSVSCYVV